MKKSSDHLSELNSAQREAALHSEGPLLIVAGAGAGKTKTITHRILNLINNGIAPENILAVTFTNKAAAEMRERISGAMHSFTGNTFSQVLGSPRQSLGQTIPKSIAGSARARGDSDRAGKEFMEPFISTFHSLGVHIIKENARSLGLTRYFTILDENDSASIIKSKMKELGIDPKQYDPKKIRNIISHEKGKFTHLPEYRERESKGRSPLGKIVAEVWNLYETQKKKEGSLDFDDLLLKSVKLLKDNEEVRQRYQERWQYLHVDEYQDTNEVQYLMCRLLTEKHKNICVVGDADQNIYSWRGANLKNILNFEKDYPGAKIVLLEENYRSTQNILSAANEIIKKNKYRPEKNLFTKNDAGEKIGLYEALDEGDEAEFVATKILEVIDGADVSLRGLSQADGPRGSAVPAGTDSDPAGEASAKFSEVAILYRANFQSRVLEEAMLRYNIPYQVLGVKFFERKEIKDTLAYLRAALNPESLSDIKRVINFPARGIGKVTLVKLFSGQKEHLPVKMRIKINNFYELLEQIREKIGSAKASEVIKFVVKKSGIEEELKNGGDEALERLENIKELATLAIKYDPSSPEGFGRAGDLKNGQGIEKLLEDAALASDQDSLIGSKKKKEDTNTVKLMTVHAAKGLEFKYVFVTGLEDGLFPSFAKASAGGPHEKEDGEEERRLFYVALTRAKEKLFLSFANFRTIFGSRQINAPSEFLSDIPGELLQKEGEEQGIKTIYLD